MLKILSLSKYDSLGASSRLRMIQYIKSNEFSVFKIILSPLISNEILKNRYKNNKYNIIDLTKSYLLRWKVLMSRHNFELIWIEKESLPWMPLWIEKKMLRNVPYVLDFDDAIFHNYDQHANSLVRRIFGRRLDNLMSGAALVVCGNNYLAERARMSGARWVEILPTVVDLNRYAIKDYFSTEKKIPIIVWIGSPSTVRYLMEIKDSLKELAKTYEFKLRVIGGNLEIQGVNLECIEWTEDSEVNLIREADIGIMPLSDSDWERGKCGYKIIQYMACGLPVVVSGIGANLEIVQYGKNGLIANRPSEWVLEIAKLLKDPLLGGSLGRAGRKSVEEKYNLEKASPHLSYFLTQASKKQNFINIQKNISPR